MAEKPLSLEDAFRMAGIQRPTRDPQLEGEKEKDPPGPMASHDFFLTGLPTKARLREVLNRSDLTGVPDDAFVQVSPVGDGGGLSRLLSLINVPLYRVSFAWPMDDNGDPQAPGGTGGPGGGNTDR